MRALLPGEAPQRLWFAHHAETFDTPCSTCGISFCAHDMPGGATRRWAAGPVAYVRFHGGTRKYVDRHPDEALTLRAMVAQTMP